MTITTGIKARPMLLPLVAILLACACEPEPASLNLQPQRSVELDLGNGSSLNGTSLNGSSLNGSSLNGSSLNGSSLNGSSLNGSSLNGVTLNATVFTGLSKSGSISGTAFTGSTWVGQLSNGTTIPLRIDAIVPLPAPNSDLFGYAVSYQGLFGWSRICGSELDGSAILAIPMSGTWNYGQNVPGAGSYVPAANTFTFACRHRAIAKCIEMGYRPWASQGKPSLINYMVSCTRLLRADYCGTGVSYTVNGTLIDLYDRLSIQTDTEPSWPIEAEWGPTGALCLAQQGQNRFLNTGLIPSCLTETANCGTFSSSGTFIIDRYLRSTLP